MDRTLRDFAWWSFDPPLASLETLVVCPECGVASFAWAWREMDVPCDDCGDHAALLCPACEEPYDHVWQREPFKTMEATHG